MKHILYILFWMLACTQVAQAQEWHFGVEAGYTLNGFHAPTLSFPVHETLMVEPTESEPKAEMDRFIATLIQIKRECEEAAASGEADNVVVNAPHTAAEICGEWSHPYTREKAAFPLDFIRESKFFPYVSKIDNGYGDRNLVCRCTE